VGDRGATTAGSKLVGFKTASSRAMLPGTRPDEKVDYRANPNSLAAKESKRPPYPFPLNII